MKGQPFELELKTEDKALIAFLKTLQEFPLWVDMGAVTACPFVL